MFLLMSQVTTEVLEVNAERLWGRLMAMADVGPGVAGGSNRQALSDEDRAGRELFLSWATAAGCSHEFDAIGNLWVRRAGSDPDASSILVGSHLDTQPTGGRFDGVYGVLGGLEVIESLNDAGIVTRHPIDVVVWMNEEGSRFPVPMMGSGVWAGKFEDDEVLAMTDIDGISVGTELARLGWAGERAAEPHAITAAFELHIEQGPVLEAEATQIGVVTGVYGNRRYSIEFGGTPAHAGPTPMEARQDPARALAATMTRVYDEVMSTFSPEGRATFALFHSHPVSPNTVPELVRCSLDMRSPSAEGLEAQDAMMRAVVAEEAERFGVTQQVDCHFDSAPVIFADGCIEAVAASAEALGYSSRRIVSGAGHDSCYVNRHAPTSMIFVPCEGGLSHNEAELITVDDAARGASVLLGAIRNADATAEV